MQTIDVPQFKERMAECFESLDRKAPSDRALKFWFDILRSHPFPRVAQAVDLWAKTKGKTPAPADINQLCDELASSERERMAASEKSIERQQVNHFMRSQGPEYAKCRKVILGMLKNPKGPRDWARRLKASEEAGEPISEVQKRAWREVLEPKELAA